jgi:hypothetical protein
MVATQETALSIELRLNIPLAVIETVINSVVRSNLCVNNLAHLLYFWLRNNFRQHRESHA